VQLNAPPAYEALSYTWGDPKAKETILCDGKKLEIGKSLFTALRTLRYTDRKRTLWIDAVCINQEDKEEKSYQVPLMCEIYRRADRVVGWVGEEENKDSAALEVQKYINLADDDRLSSREIETWLALSSFIQRPWFSRVWIIQELAVAKSLTIHCGTKQLEWSILRDAMPAFLRRFGLYLNTTNTDVSLERVFTLLAIRNLVTEHKPDFKLPSVRLQELELSRIDAGRTNKQVRPGDLLQFVQGTRLFGATEPKDRIFALLGLAPRSDSESVTVNYLVSQSEVYKQFAQTMISQSSTLDILSQASQGDSPPSWVPDWSRPLKTYPLNLAAYNASRTSANTLVRFSMPYSVHIILTV
jgi:hypothetical protein